MKNILFDTTRLVFGHACLVCRRKTMGALLCKRCQPPEPLYAKYDRCQKCFSQAIELNGSGLCKTCKNLPLIFKSVRYLWEYDQEVKDIITTMKYKPSILLCKFMAQKLANVLNNYHNEDSWDLVVPVPSSFKSLQTRCFNQCIYLAQAIRKEFFNSPLQNRDLYALEHIGSNKAQASLKHKQRISNVINAFYANQELVSKKRVLLIDDVITTGATSTSAGLSLLRKGAATVDLIALARSEAWQQFRFQIDRKIVQN